MRSFVLRVVLEPDEGMWRAYIPELEAKGAATWGHTREDALRNMQEVRPDDHGGVGGRWRAAAAERNGFRPAARSGQPMTLDYSRLHSVTSRDLVSAHQRDGLSLARQREPSPLSPSRWTSRHGFVPPCIGHIPHRPAAKHDRNSSSLERGRPAPPPPACVIFMPRQAGVPARAPEGASSEPCLLGWRIFNFHRE